MQRSVNKITDEIMKGLTVSLLQYINIVNKKRLNYIQKSESFKKSLKSSLGRSHISTAYKLKFPIEGIRFINLFTMQYITSI